MKIYAVEYDWETGELTVDEFEVRVRGKGLWSDKTAGLAFQCRRSFKKGEFAESKAEAIQRFIDKRSADLERYSAEAKIALTQIEIAESMKAKLAL